jgi:hypothetical protein
MAYIEMDVETSSPASPADGVIIYADADEILRVKDSSGGVKLAAVGDNTITDAYIGNRTATPTSVPSGNTGTLSNFISWFANRIKAITGKTNWYDTPDTTIAALNTDVNTLQTDLADLDQDFDLHAGNSSNPHDVNLTQVSNMRRQGGNSSNWATPGTNTYTPAAVQIQIGTIQWTGVGANTGSITVTFPDEFIDPPRIFTEATGNRWLHVITESTTETEVVLRWITINSQIITSANIGWMAVGRGA